MVLFSNIIYKATKKISMSVYISVAGVAQEFSELQCLLGESPNMHQKADCSTTVHFSWCAWTGFILSYKLNYFRLMAIDT